MKRNRTGPPTPTEREWLIMETLWDSDAPLTAAEIYRRIDSGARMELRTARVLLHRLCQRGLVGSTVDEHDSRIYHYRAVRTREACQREKSRDFIDAYFRGDGSGAAAAFLQNTDLTDEQIRELEDILESRKGGGTP